MSQGDKKREVKGCIGIGYSHGGWGYGADCGAVVSGRCSSFHTLLSVLPLQKAAVGHSLTRNPSAQGITILTGAS